MTTMKAKILYCLQEAAADSFGREDGHEIEWKIRKSVSYYRLKPVKV